MTTLDTSYFAMRIRTGSEPLIELRGELDLGSVSTFEAVIRDLDLSSWRHVVLDLGRLAFMDVAGLHAVMALHAACLEVSTGLVIMPGPRTVQRVFELTGVAGLLPFKPR